MILAHSIYTVKTLFILINIESSRRLSTTRFSWAPTQTRAQKNRSRYRLFGFGASPVVTPRQLEDFGTFTHTPKNCISLRHVGRLPKNNNWEPVTQLQRRLQVLKIALQVKLQVAL